MEACRNIDHFRLLAKEQKTNSLMPGLFDDLDKLI